MDIAYVKQRGDWDCGVASIAMATATPYNAVLSDLNTNPERGVNEVDLVDWLFRHGWAWQQITRNIRRGGSYVERSPWPPLPFAPSHIAQVEAPQGWHFTVMDKDGRVFDPWDEKRDTLNHADYGQVTWVIGLFKVN